MGAEDRIRLAEVAPAAPGEPAGLSGVDQQGDRERARQGDVGLAPRQARGRRERGPEHGQPHCGLERSEEHTSELQSRLHLVCRLLLEKKKKHTKICIMLEIRRALEDWET